MEVAFETSDFGVLVFGVQACLFRRVLEIFGSIRWVGAGILEMG